MNSVARLLAASALGALVLSALAAPQPERQRPAVQPGQPDERAMRWLTPERLKARLENRLKQTETDIGILETRREALRRSIDRLAQGDATEDVAREWLEADRAERDLRPREEGGPPLQQPPERPVGDRPNVDQRVPGDQRPMRGPEEGRGGPPRDLGPEDRERMRKTLEEEFPRIHARLIALGPDAAPDAERMFMRLLPRLRELHDLRERDPEMADIRRRELQATFDIAAASRALRDLWRAEVRDEAAISARRAELRQAFADAFDARSDSQALEIGRLNERVDSLEKELADRRANRDALIDDQLERLELEARVGRRPPSGG